MVVWLFYLGIGYKIDNYKFLKFRIYGGGGF